MFHNVQCIKRIVRYHTSDVAESTIADSELKKYGLVSDLSVLLTHQVLHHWYANRPSMPTSFISYLNPEYPRHQDVNLREN